MMPLPWDDPGWISLGEPCQKTRGPRPDVVEAITFPPFHSGWWPLPVAPQGGGRALMVAYVIRPPVGLDVMEDGGGVWRVKI